MELKDQFNLFVSKIRTLFRFFSFSGLSGKGKKGRRFLEFLQIQEESTTEEVIHITRILDYKGKMLHELSVWLHTSISNTVSAAYVKAAASFRLNELKMLS